jgi:hypothetical protein
MTSLSNTINRREFIKRIAVFSFSLLFLQSFNAIFFNDKKDKTLSSKGYGSGGYGI